MVRDETFRKESVELMCGENWRKLAEVVGNADTEWKGPTSYES